jgi:hypothetical protein
VPQTFTLTKPHRDAFDRVGVLRLPGFYAAVDIAVMADRLWADLERRFGAVRDDPATWRTVRPGQFQSLERKGAFSALGSPDLFALADALLGAGAWDPPRRWGQPLVTFPAATWDLPHVMWHFDHPVAEGGGQLPAVRVFVLLEPVLPHGGGTLFVAGAHRVAMALAGKGGTPVPSAKMREMLRADHPWFARLWDTPGDDVRDLLEESARVQGVEVGLEEMTGDAGDIFVMHPLMLHGAAHNALEQPRMMLAQSLCRQGGFR